MRPTPPFPASVDALTDRQRQCLTLASRGLTSGRIAATLGLSPRTVDEHLADDGSILSPVPAPHPPTAPAAVPGVIDAGASPRTGGCA